MYTHVFFNCVMEDLYSLSSVVREIVGDDLMSAKLDEFIPKEGPLCISPDRFVSLIADVKLIQDATVHVFKHFEFDDHELFSISPTNDLDLIEEFMRYFDVSEQTMEKFQFYRKNPAKVSDWDTDYRHTRTLIKLCIKYDDEYGIRQLLTLYKNETLLLLVQERKLIYLKKYNPEISSQKGPVAWELMKYIGKLFESAGSNGDLECIQWLLEHTHPGLRTLKAASACCSAAENGHIECVKWTCENTNISSYMHDYNDSPFRFAARAGQLKCLEFLYEYHIKKFNRSTLDKINSWVSKSAAENGHINCLRYLEKSGYRFDERICEHAAQNKNTDCLEYLYKLGYSLSVLTCQNALDYGSINCLRYAYENGVRPVDIHIEHAAKLGYLECIQYAHSCEMFTKQHICGVMHNLTVLKWLHESDLLLCDESRDFDLYDLYDWKECFEYILKNKIAPIVVSKYWRHGNTEILKLINKYRDGHYPPLPKPIS